MQKDKFNNPQGSNFDLVADGTQNGKLIAVIHLYTGEGFDFSLPKKALEEKGFTLHRWTSVPSTEGADFHDDDDDDYDGDDDTCW